MPAARLLAPRPSKDCSTRTTLPAPARARKAAHQPPTVPPPTTTTSAESRPRIRLTGHFSCARLRPSHKLNSQSNVSILTTGRLSMYGLSKEDLELQARARGFVDGLIPYEAEAELNGGELAEDVDNGYRATRRDLG